jgi:VanZ family protein
MKAVLQRLDPVRLWHAAGWLGVALALALSLLPPAVDNAAGHGDKLVHFLGYATLMLWWAQLTRQRWKLALAVVLFSGAIEVLQPTRQPELLDLLANSSGVALGWLAARVLDRSPARGSLPRYLATLPAARR